MCFSFFEGFFGFIAPTLSFLYNPLISMILQALLRNATDAMRESRVLEIINTVRHYSYMYWQNIRWLVGPDMPLWQYIFQIISWLCFFKNLIQVVGALLHFRKFSVENIHGTLDCWYTSVCSYMYCFENLTLVLSALLNLCAISFLHGYCLWTWVCFCMKITCVSSTYIP